MSASNRGELQLLSDIGSSRSVDMAQRIIRHSSLLPSDRFILRHSHGGIDSEFFHNATIWRDRHCNRWWVGVTSLERRRQPAG